jgi:hypothetical protein
MLTLKFVFIGDGLPQVIGFIGSCFEEKEAILATRVVAMTRREAVA